GRRRPAALGLVGQRGGSGDGVAGACATARRRADHAVRQHAARDRARCPAAGEQHERVGRRERRARRADRAEPRGRVHRPDGPRERRARVTPMSFSPGRWIGIMLKEFIQLQRDRLTFGMIIGIPVLQLLLFGFAINSDPRQLPTAVLSMDNSPYSRSIVAALQNSGYFALTANARTTRDVDELLARGRVQFAVTIPEDFSRRLVRNEQPVLLVEADATDPASTSNALATLGTLVDAVVARDAAGVLQPRP